MRYSIHAYVLEMKGLPLAATTKMFTPLKGVDPNSTYTV